MTTTRRDLMKLASALGLAGTVPTMADRVAAMTHLNQRASANILRRRRVRGRRGADAQ
jgi:hypothetical protein